MAAGFKALWVALLGFVVPFALGFAASFRLFDLSLLAALFVGGTFTATSIGNAAASFSGIDLWNHWFRHGAAFHVRAPGAA